MNEDSVLFLVYIEQSNNLPLSLQLCTSIIIIIKRRFPVSLLQAARKASTIRRQLDQHTKKQEMNNDHKVYSREGDEVRRRKAPAHDEKTKKKEEENAGDGSGDGEWHK
jgi:formamidopyrimidine-DNA glycosylase